MRVNLDYYRIMVLIVFIVTLGYSNASAQEPVQPKKISQVIKLYQGVLKFPPPLWVEKVEDMTNVKNFQNQQKNMFTLEQIPKDQEFDNWDQLYGVYGFYLPEYDMKRFLSESLNALALGCKVQSKSKVVSAENGKIILTYFCSDLQDPLVVDGNNTESGFLFMSRVDQSFAKVYMAWRAPNKDWKDFFLKSTFGAIEVLNPENLTNLFQLS